MAEKFKGTYRIESARWQSWDYGRNGAYFITICTKDRRHFFGKVVNQQMILSPVGQLAEQFWYEIIDHAKNVVLDQFVVMPNHIHGILILDNPNDNNGNDGAKTVSKSGKKSGFNHYWGIQIRGDKKCPPIGS
ncbi:hypothetical protein [Synechocystis sp. LKSZ1]|uniref:hypothetical protein n=1 Tax=Synechocystis sp. LKSZ1 TaxID=3144951 RepID=UPI00336C00FD